MAFRKNFKLMHLLSVNVVAPIRRLQTALAAKLPFSLAEALLALVIAWLIWKIAHRKWKKLFTGLITLALFAYAGFCFLWGTYYYGDAGEQAPPISVGQLTEVTRYFADRCSKTWVDEPDRADVLAKSAEMNGGIGCKKIVCSKIMSYLDFQGFFFPFTGEANVNTDMPAHDLASTCAHELCHLNGIAREQEANYHAVLDSYDSGDAAYVYSASLMAYTYLSNALYSADREAWQTIAESLDERVNEDLMESREYWAKFDTGVKKVSNTVYEGFLQSYGQELGLQSYGACVDLLVNHYYPLIFQAGT